MFFFHSGINNYCATVQNIYPWLVKGSESEASLRNIKEFPPLFTLVADCVNSSWDALSYSCPPGWTTSINAFAKADLIGMLIRVMVFTGSVLEFCVPDFQIYLVILLYSLAKLGCPLAFYLEKVRIAYMNATGL